MLAARRSLLPWTAALLVAVFAFPASASAQDGVRRDATATKAATFFDQGSQRSNDVAVYALGLIGVDYRLGGDSPQTGLDCSGLVRHVFGHVAGVALPRTAKEQSRLGGSVSANDLAPGDLVFFNTRRFAYSHVGIYLGDKRFVHAPHTGRSVEIADFANNYWQQRFNGARRLVGAGAAAAPPDDQVRINVPAHRDGQGAAAFPYDMTGG